MMSDKIFLAAEMQTMFMETDDVRSRRTAYLTLGLYISVPDGIQCGIAVPQVLINNYSAKTFSLLVPAKPVGRGSCINAVSLYPVAPKRANQHKT